MVIFNLGKISFKKNFASGKAMWNKAECVQFRGGGGRDEVCDRETMFSQLAKRSPRVVVSG